MCDEHGESVGASGIYFTLESYCEYVIFWREIELVTINLLHSKLKQSKKGIKTSSSL